MRLCLLKRPICATCPNVFIVKALRELQRCLRAYERKRTRKPIKLQLYPHDTRLRRNCHREILATCAILFQSRGLQIAFVKVSPARRGAALPGVNLRRVSATNTKLIALQSCNKLFLRPDSLFTRALNLPSSCTRYAIFA